MSDVISGVLDVWRRRVAVGVLAVAQVLAATAVAEAQTPTTSTATTPTGTTGSTATGTTGSGGSGGSVLDLGHNGRVVFVAVVVGLFAALWFALLVQDRIKTNRRIDRLLAALISDTERRGDDQRVTVAEIEALTRAASTRGAPGLTRTTIALGLLTLVAVALTALLVGVGNNASDLLKTVVTALTTALTTVIGFYFGARTVSDAVGQGGDVAGAGGAKPSGPPGAPTITSVTAGDGAVTVEFTAPEKTGGSAITEYTVTSDPGAFKASGKLSPITVPGLTNGTPYTFTVRAANASGYGPESSKSESATPGGASPMPH
jgi:fibronectin type III domain protein